MYVAAMPVALSYYFVWNPGESKRNELFPYIVGIAIFVHLDYAMRNRSALVAEITDD